MNSNGIKKALECISGEEVLCHDCKYSAHSFYPKCKCEAGKDALDLINQYEAEIVRLKQIVGFTPARHSGKSPFLNMVLDNVRAEAIKEFAERLKEKAIRVDLYGKILYTTTIDNLLKEMGVNE